MFKRSLYKALYKNSDDYKNNYAHHKSMVGSIHCRHGRALDPSIYVFLQQLKV